MNAPLAERMRPTTLDQYIGQQHLLAPNASLRRALDAGVIPSMIFWGPPGVGKTTLAQLIAQHLQRPIHTLSAISSGVKDVREIIAKVQGGGMFTPKGSIDDHRNLWVLASRFNQCFGEFRGTVTLKETGATYLLDGLTGWCEDHYAKW